MKTQYHPPLSPGTWKPDPILVALTLLSASPAFAGTIYWDGTGTDWANTANWSTAAGAETPDPAAVPGAADDVVFNISTLTTNQVIGMGGANQAARSLTFSSTGTVNLGSGGGNRDLAIGSGGIVLESGAGNVTIGSSGAGSNVYVRLATSQTWTNNSASGLTSRNVTTGLATGTAPVTLTLSANSTGSINNSGSLNDGLEGAVVSLVVDSSGTGSSNLSGGNFSGGTTIKRGLLSTSGTLGSGDILLGDTSGSADARLNVSGTVASDLTVRSGSSGVLSITGSGTNNFTGGILLNNNLTVGSLSSSGQTLNISGVISGTGDLTAARLGSNTPTVVLTGANTFVGKTSIDSAILVVDSLNRVTSGSASSSLGAAPTDAIAGTIRMSAVSASTLRYAGAGEATDRIIEVATNAGATLQHNGTGLLTFEGDVTMSGTGSRTLTLRGTSEQTAEISGEIQNIGGGFNTSVTKTDSGTWKLTGLNSYTGFTSITGGVLEVMTMADGGVASSIGASSNSSGNLSFGGGTLRYLGSGGSTNRIFNVGAAGAVFDASGTGALSFTNTTAPTHSSTSTPRTITLTGTNTGDNSMANRIGNAGTTGLTSIVKDGTGTWVLKSANTYTGDTTVNDGKLVIDTGGSLHSGSTVSVAGGELNVDGTVGGAVAVSSGAKLSGSGTISGGVNVSTGGFLNPGNSPGNLTIDNGLTLNGTFTWDLTSLSTTNPGTDFDILTIASGNVDLTGATLGLNLGDFTPSTDPFWQTAQTWSGILNNTGLGPLTGAFASIDNSAWSSLGTFTTTYTDNDVNLVWTVVPEPGAAMVAGTLGLIALLRRRRA